MANVLFTNARIFDGPGAAPYAGEVLVQGNRIARVGAQPGARTLPRAGAIVVDCAGATLMPGMVEAHTHFSWNDQPGLSAIQRMPTEEHILWCAHIAKRYLDMGCTSCVGAATAKPRLDVVIRNAIESGQIPGPRYLAASQEITVPGGLGDETLPHLPYPEFSFGAIVSGAGGDAQDACACSSSTASTRSSSTCPANTSPGLPAEFTPMTDAEIADGGDRSAHARQAPGGARAFERIGEAVRAPRHRADLSRELRRRGSARHAGGEQGQALRRAGYRVADQHLVPRVRVGHHARYREEHGLPPRARGRVRVAAEDEASAASASCPAATTASRGSSTAPTRRTSSTS